jgi:hypothetical protein
MTQFFQNVTEILSVGTLVQLPIAGFLAYQVWRFSALQAAYSERLKNLEIAILTLRRHRHTENNNAQVQETRMSILEYRASKESK